jgi:hypothetical protein
MFMGPHSQAGRDQHRFHEPGRDVDQEPGDVAEGDRFEVEADRFEGPALDQLAALRLLGMPKITNKINGTAAACLLVAKLGKVTGDLCLHLATADEVTD